MRLFICAVALVALSSVSAKACEGYAPVVPVDPGPVIDAPVDPAAVSFAPAYAQVRSFAFAPLFASSYGVGYSPAAVVVNRAVVVRHAPLVVVRNRRARVVVVR